MAQPDENVETTGAEDQAEIAWAEDLLADFKPMPADEAGDNGEAEVEPETEAVEDSTEGEETEAEPEAETGEEAKEPDKPTAIDESAYDTQVAVKNDDGSVSYKTVGQLVEEGMLKADFTRKTQELSRKRDNLKEDENILKLLDTDKHARDYLKKRFQDIQDGKVVPGKPGAVEIPQEMIDNNPWLKQILDKLEEHDVEFYKSRTVQEQTQADQTVGKIDSIMTDAMASIEKETESKLEPSVFRARVGKVIQDSISSEVPEDARISVMGQLILADKNYFLSKAREAYQQELDVAKEKVITAAQQERAKKVAKPKPLQGGSTSVASKDVGEFKVVKDKHGRPDMDAFLESAFKGGRKK